MKRTATLAIGCCALFLTACMNVRQDAPIEGQQGEQLHQQVKVYQQGDLAGVNYSAVGPLEASSCRWMLWDTTPTEQSVTDQLLLKARGMNADGITEVSCESGTGSALARDCWSRVACTAVAIRLAAPPASGR
jgi:hypothetical protein